MEKTLACVCVCACLVLVQVHGELRCIDSTRCHNIAYMYSTRSEVQYLVEGHSTIISFVDGIYLDLDCNGWAALDSPALPCFTKEFRVPRVTLRNCPPPADNSSFADTLLKLNVTLQLSARVGNFTLMSLPPHPPLDATHFIGFESLVHLRLIGYPTRDQPKPVAGFLRELRSLRLLEIKRVRLPAGELAHLPTSLHELHLHMTAVELPPEAVLALPNLRDLTLSEKSISEFSVSPTLRTLSLESKNTAVQVESIPALEALTIVKWSQKRPVALEQCNALREFQLLSPAMLSLPGRWVTSCPRLKRLIIQYASYLTSLPPKLLEDATALELLALSYGVLETLPMGLLDFVPNLRVLNLVGNRLLMLPSGLFANQLALQYLDLSQNKLTAAVQDSLGYLHSIVELKLDYNPHLGDLCVQQFGNAGYSRLLFMTKLRTLSLSHTNVTHICRDWREQLTFLETLNLIKTGISVLYFSDLQYIRDDSVTNSVVLLDGAPVVSLHYTEDDYKMSQIVAATKALVQLDHKARFECDCHMYWTRLALFPANNESHIVPRRMSRVRCSDGRLLRDVPPKEMVCLGEKSYNPCSEALLPAACTCAVRPEAGQVGYQTLVQVHCEGTDLCQVPPLRAVPGVIYDLFLANNNISKLRVTDLPRSWRKLDIRNNSLKQVDETTALELVRSPRRLLLAGNPLQCDCNAAPLLIALQSVDEDTFDLRATTCADGSPLYNLDSSPCFITLNGMHSLFYNLRPVSAAGARTPCYTLYVCLIYQTYKILFSLV